MTTYHASLLSLCATVQALIDQEFEKVSHKPKPGSALDQLGLKDGTATVEDFMRHGEEGLAFEHLIYMADETCDLITYPAEVVESFTVLSQALSVPLPVGFCVSEP